MTARFVENKKDGQAKGWHPNGQLAFDYNWKEDKEHGICIEYDTDGTKLSELRFEEGEVVENLMEPGAEKPELPSIPAPTKPEPPKPDPVDPVDPQPPSPLPPLTPSSY